MGETLLSDKKNYSNIVKNNYFPTSKNKINALVILSDENLLSQLEAGLKVLPVNFLVLSKWTSDNNIVYDAQVKNDLLWGFDVVISDNGVEWLQKYFQNGIVPVVPTNNYLKTILSEFEVLDGEGNAFLYEENNIWSLFFALSRFIENHKYTYDHKVLVKNVLAL